ncbi:MAG: TldD/PmbA family protein, partial [Sphingomonadaceae bacterium]
MLEVREAEERAAALVERARKAGADAADAVYIGDASTGVQVRLGKLEDVDRSEGEEIGLRLFVGRRFATVSSSDLSHRALGELVERAVPMAREAPQDPYAGLAPEEMLLAGAAPDVAGDDGKDPPPLLLKERALEMEAAARAVEGITNSEGAMLRAGRSVVALATSHGFARGYSTSGYSAGVSVIAGSGGGMQRDQASHSTRDFASLDAPERLGRLAAERTLARLDPAKVPSGAMPILFDPRTSHTLVGHFLSAITGPAVTRKTSFLLDKEGERVFAEGIAVRDDPHRPRGLRSKPFDGEGLPTAPRALVADGVLPGWLLDSASARQLGREPTG